MSERMIRVPESLVVDAIQAADESKRDYTADRLRALLSQPTPTAEPFRPAPDGWFTFGSHVEFDGPLQFSEERDEAGDPLWERHPEKPPEPPRIEDMAPGTTFWGNHFDPEEPAQWWIVGDNFVAGTHCGEAHPKDIDPSTIRDIKPPTGDTA